MGVVKSACIRGPIVNFLRQEKTSSKSFLLPVILSAAYIPSAAAHGKPVAAPTYHTFSIFSSVPMIGNKSLLTPSIPGQIYSNSIAMLENFFLKYAVNRRLNRAVLFDGLCAYVYKTSPPPRRILLSPVTQK